MEKGINLGEKAEKGESSKKKDGLMDFLGNIDKSEKLEHSDDDGE